MKQARAQGTAAAAAAAGNEADEYTDHGAIAAAAAAGNEADEQAEAAVFANYTPKLVLVRGAARRARSASQKACLKSPSVARHAGRQATPRPCGGDRHAGCVRCLAPRAALRR